MKRIRLFLAAFMLAMLAACATVTPPQSPEDYVRSAQAQVGAIYQTIGDLKASGEITQAQAKNAIAQADLLEQQVDTAASMLAGNPTGAQALSKSAVAGLLAIKATLPKPKGK